MFVLKVSGSFLSSIGDDISVTSSHSEAIGFHSSHQANAAAQTLAKFYGVKFDAIQMFSIEGSAEEHNLERSVRRELRNLNEKTGRSYARMSGQFVELTYTKRSSKVRVLSERVSNEKMLCIIRDATHIRA
jgi:hypothetical protein